MLILKRTDGKKVKLRARRQILISADDPERLCVSVFLGGEIDASYAPMSRADLATRIGGFLDPSCERP